MLSQRIEGVTNGGVDLGGEGTIFGDLGVDGDGLGVVAQKGALFSELLGFGSGLHRVLVSRR